MLNKNGEPDAMKVASPVRRGVHVPTIRKIGWPEPTLLMSAMLTSLSFGNIYQTEGSYLTLIVMNFVIAIALLFTPLLTRSLIGEGVQSTAQTIGTTAVFAAAALPARMLTIKQVTQQELSFMRGYAKNKIQSVQNKINRPRGS
ncbi:MAG: hypothetical protein JNL11_15095 [Bdellovibrionaceae bacterium]|nr:hypothetical protein [Pseudobdellovibrionaceae bacterium]